MVLDLKKLPGIFVKHFVYTVNIFTKNRYLLLLYNSQSVK